MHTELIDSRPAAGSLSPTRDRPVVARDSLRARMMALASAPWFEAATVAALLVGMFGVFLIRLSSVVISDMDEGTYLYGGKLIATGLTPYRDFLLVHPPVAVYLAAAWVLLAGDGVMAERFANLAFVLASTIPLYLTIRHLTRSRVAGLLGIATYMTGILLLANMGRTLKLEPVMNVFLIWAFALYTLRPRNLWVRGVFGMLVAAAVFTKLVAVIPVGLIVLGDLIWCRKSWRQFARAWLAAAVGFALVAVPLGLFLVSQPHFLDDVVWSQLDRGGLPLDLRLRYLLQDFTRFPAIPLALLASIWYVLRARDARVRVSSLVALVGMAVLVVGFKTFFTYYIVLVMPWLAILFVVAVRDALRRFSVRLWQPAMAGLVLVTALLVPVAYDEAYYRTGTMHVASPAHIIPMLEQGNGPIYAMYPLFALWSGRPEYSWYYSADALIPRMTGKWTSADFITAFTGTTAVVLWDGELNEYADAQAYLDANYQLAYQDGYFSLWLRHTT